MQFVVITGNNGLLLLMMMWSVMSSDVGLTSVNALAEHCRYKLIYTTESR